MREEVMVGYASEQFSSAAFVFVADQSWFRNMIYNKEDGVKNKSSMYQHIEMYNFVACNYFHFTFQYSQHPVLLRLKTVVCLRVSISALLVQNLFFSDFFLCDCFLKKAVRVLG